MNEKPAPAPRRKRLPHTAPAWINPEREVYFITVCCEMRGWNSLARDETALPLMESVRYRNEGQWWWCSAFVVMPDHIHGLFRFPNPSGETAMRQTMRSWKGWTAKLVGIRWQRDWFDHRLRSDESEKEKANYIRMNPVRAGLVERPEDWPYYFLAESE